MPSRPQIQVRVPGLDDDADTDFRSAYLRSQARSEELAQERDGLAKRLAKAEERANDAKLRADLAEEALRTWEADERDWDSVLCSETACLKEARRLIRRVESNASWERVLRAYERLKRVVEAEDGRRR